MVFRKKEEEPILVDNGVGNILIGEELLSLPEETLRAFAAQISGALAEHPDSMLQYTPEQLLGIINEGRAIVVVHPETGSCNAFAQLHVWYEGEGEEKKQGAIEMRSWLSWKNGNGRLAVKGARDLSRQMFPNVPLFAIVAVFNDSAKDKLLSYGAEIAPRPVCIGCDLKDGETPVPTQAILLSNIQ